MNRRTLSTPRWCLGEAGGARIRTNHKLRFKLRREKEQRNVWGSVGQGKAHAGVAKRSGILTMSELAILLNDVWIGDSSYRLLKIYAILLIDCWKLSILVGIHLYIIIHKGSFTFRCQCFSLTMSELSPNYLCLTWTRYNNNMISTGLTSRQIGATTASHQSAPPHHMPPGTYWLSVGAWLRRQRPLSTAVGLSLFTMWWWFMSGRFSPNLPLLMN